MTEVELLIDFHKSADRQGPGSSNVTLKALSFILKKNKAPLKIADIGCGTGAQTISLAENIVGEISAVDLFPDFLEKLEANSKKLGLNKKIKAIELLQSQAYNISEVAYACGFNSLSYFSQAFKSHSGKSPSEWMDGQSKSLSDKA